MRMGYTFSRALDPNKPLLFGDFPLDILEEEVWHPSARRLAWQDPLTGLTSDLNPEQTSGSPTASPAEDPGADMQTPGKLQKTAKRLSAISRYMQSRLKSCVYIVMSSLILLFQ